MNDEIRQKIEQARKAGKSIGLVQGSWDMFHLGHLCYLQEARKTCDFLVVAMDDDEKIRYRKGNNRPIIPLEERYQTINRLKIADALVVKTLDEPHWGLIKELRPDVLVVIKENYRDDELAQLEQICGKVAVLPRQATTSTSDIIRRTLIKNGVKSLLQKDPRIKEAVQRLRERVSKAKDLPEPWGDLLNYAKMSTDWKTPVAAGCFYEGKWHFGVNQVDQALNITDIEGRSELFYGTVEHAEVNMLKGLGEVEKLDTPVYVVLFPCDACMKILIDKGVRKIYYLEDHPEKNWSKRSHAKAREKGVETIKVVIDEQGQVHEEPDLVKEKQISVEESNRLYGQYKYIDPRNARGQDQLEVMFRNEYAGKDPLALENVDSDQEIVCKKKFWYVTKNRYPYEGVEHQFVIFALGPVYSIEEVSPEMWAELQEIWADLRKKYELPGGALCFRFGDTLRSKASLKRVHCHVIVPKEGSKVSFSIGNTRRGLKPGLVIPVK